MLRKKALVAPLKVMLDTFKEVALRRPLSSASLGIGQLHHSFGFREERHPVLRAINIMV
jgi:hypothetical protein